MAGASVDNLIPALQSYENGSGSTTSQRVWNGFNLIYSFKTREEDSAGPIIGDRVTLVTTQGIIIDGNIRNWNPESKKYDVVLDNGEFVENVEDNEIAVLVTEKNERLDYVSRVLWANAVSESRVPFQQEHLMADICPWEMFETAFHLTLPWTRDLWSSPAQLTEINIASWFYLFAESFRMKTLGSLMLSLRIVEEAEKHLTAMETEDREEDGASADNSPIAGIGRLVQFWPLAVFALGNSGSRQPYNKGFALLRYMLSSQAVKIIRAVYRQPSQRDLGSSTPMTVDKTMLIERCQFYVEMQRDAEDTLRTCLYPSVVANPLGDSADGISHSLLPTTKSVLGVFGDGQSSWNQAWIRSVQSDAVGVCRALRHAIDLADGPDGNDFVASKARWDLAGYITLGGEGGSYDLRDIRKLDEEAEQAAARLDSIGMKFFAEGESMVRSMVKSILIGYSGKPPHVVQSRSIAKAPSCAQCQSSSGKLALCGKCKSVSYCSRECQKAHFKVHKKVCKST